MTLDLTNLPRPKSQGRFDSLLPICRDKVLVHTGAQLCELFDSVDQTLLEFAQKAESNEIQGRFFDAIGEVRNKRPLVEQRFREQVESAFDHFGQPDLACPSSVAASSFDLEKMSLVAHEEIEESVAIDNIIAKARDAYYENLYALGACPRIAQSVE